MQALTIFDFDNQSIRTGDIDGRPVFCLTDLLAAMGSNTDPHKAKDVVLDTFGEGQVIKLPLETPGGVQEATFVFEAGATFLISRSRTETGKKLNRWLHAEILPSIRKTGGYQKPVNTIDALIAGLQELKAVQERQELLEAKLALEAQRTDHLEQLIHQHDGEIDRIFNPHGRYFTVVGYASAKGMRIDIRAAASIGKKCSQYCKEQEIPVEQLSDPRFGRVGSYPDSVIQKFL